MAPGTRNKFGAPVLVPEILRKEIYCSEESTCDLLELFGALRSNLEPTRSDSASP